MKFAFRGHSYEVLAPIQLTASTNQPKAKLVYRGHTYDYPSQPVVISKIVEPNMVKVSLVYRGSTYVHQLISSKFCQKPYTIHCRYQVPLES
jgi:hypothetical protein